VQNLNADQDPDRAPLCPRCDLRWDGYPFTCECRLTDDGRPLEADVVKGMRSISSVSSPFASPATVQRAIATGFVQTYLMRQPQGRPAQWTVPTSLNAGISSYRASFRQGGSTVTSSG